MGEVDAGAGTGADGAAKGTSGVSGLTDRGAGGGSAEVSAMRRADRLRRVPRSVLCIPPRFRPPSRVAMSPS